MRRLISTPRDHWEAKVEAAGITWYSGDQTPSALLESEGAYWNESAFYEITPREVEVLECGTNELAGMTIRAAQHIIENKLYSKMGIPESAIPLIESSWDAEPPSLYGRFDLAYDGSSPPKLLEYNADTPTSLLEAAVVQWYWLQDLFPFRDQFNSIHERLVARWTELRMYLPGEHIDFCSIDDAEDGMTVAYLLDTARQAGLTATMFPIDEIGWDGVSFRGPDDQLLGAIFKLYPWEWMVREEFGTHLGKDRTIWIEPPWKMLLSNKGILPILWDLYPHHPNILEARFDSAGQMNAWVRKPLLGREGANTTLHRPGLDVETSGTYGAEGFVFQELASLGRFGDVHQVVGSWVIGHEKNASCGIGVRESESPIITNTSRFVPHLIG